MTVLQLREVLNPVSVWRRPVRTILLPCDGSDPASQRLGDLPRAQEPLHRSAFHATLFHDTLIGEEA